MSYKVTKQYVNRPEIHCNEFATAAEAKNFVNECLANDEIYKLNVTYRIFYRGACVEVCKQETFAKMKPEESAAGQSSQGQQSSVSFSPTPLAMAPRPSGMPPKWATGGNDEDKSKDEDIK
jgi:hypothetical protein